MTLKKQDQRWPDAHLNLKRLYEERVPRGMTQEEFGATFNIGTQGMVWQYLNGHRPLNLEAAAKFARGLRVTIQDISPEMAAALQRDILPVLGTKMLKAALAKAAMVLVFAVPPLIPTPAEAAEQILHNAYSQYALWRNHHWRVLLAMLRRGIFAMRNAGKMINQAVRNSSLSWA